MQVNSYKELQGKPLPQLTMMLTEEIQAWTNLCIVFLFLCDKIVTPQLAARYETQKD